MRTCFLVALTCFALAACTSKPILNIQNEHVPTALNGQSLAMADVENGIVLAARRLDWNTRVIKPGLIEASLTVRSHRAVVEIPYSAASYSIVFKSSDNLDADGETIHRRYNGYVTRLNREISRQLGAVRTPAR